MYDLVIKNGKIIDGTGSPSYYCDIAVCEGKIVRIAKNITDGKQIIDAKGLTVTPGFIDSHSHSDAQILTYPDQIEKIEQGITTSIGGQCGTTKAPIGIDAEVCEIEGFGKNTDVYRTMGSFLEIAKDIPLGSNIATFVGHRALRSAVIGEENRAPSADELEQMQALLSEGMEHGAIGVSFGLIYHPSCFAQTDELIALAQTAAQYNGLVAAHIRNEGDELVQATEEFISIIKASGARGILSHHKAAYKNNWGKVSATLRMIDKANEEGFDIYCDVYPYTASQTTLCARYIPKEFQSGGNAAMAERLADPEIRKQIKERNIKLFGANNDLSDVLITVCSGYPQYVGKRVSEITALHGKDSYETVMDMIRDSINNCYACYFTMCEEDVETVMAHPRAMICTDSEVAGKKTAYHPRMRGSFPRALGRYVRERNVVSLPEMIRKMTSMPAAVYGLKNKGILREGFDADICIFDFEKIIDRADYTDCLKRAEGLNYVILSGAVVAENAVYNGKRLGKVILKK